MRISGKNLNKKEENPLPRPRPPLQKSFYPRNNYPPPIVKRTNPALIVAGVVLGLAILIPVAVFVGGIVAAIAVPSLLSSRESANQAAAIRDLRNFHTAQSTFISSMGSNTFGGFEDLAKARLIDGERFTRPSSRYSYTLTLNAEKNRYCLLASPANNQRAYGIGTDGVIYHAAAGGIACASGELKGSEMQPLQ